MSGWRELEDAAPDIAGAGRRLLEDPSGTPGVAFLATVSIDGCPRLHPFVPAIVDRALYAFIIASPKRRDLDRDGAYAVHSRLGDNDESFFVAGHARRVDGELQRARVADRMPYDDVDDNHVLYEFSIARTLWTTWTSPTRPVYRSWRAQ